MTGNRFLKRILAIFAGTALVCTLLFPGCSREPSWKSLNDQIMQEKNITLQSRDDIPKTGVVPSLAPGQVISKAELPDVTLAPGVTGKMYWGKGTLINVMSMKPGAEIPKETLPGERLMLVWKGSVEQLINGKFVTMRQYNTVTHSTSTPHRDFVYMKKGAENAMKAGSEGAEIIEVYWPVRADYIEKAGGKTPGKQAAASFGVTPSAGLSWGLTANEVNDLYDVQFTDLSLTTANSRLINGEGFQCSFLSCDPGRESPFHAHPEEQLSIILRGTVKEKVMDTAYEMKEGDIMYLPGGMVHRGEYAARGCDMLDVFWPPRPDFIQKQNDQLARYHTIFPEDAKLELVHNGEESEPFLDFTEGPTWMDGKLFFSNMWFASDMSAGDPQKSNFIRMDADGSFKIIANNMQFNGTMPLGNGNLAVCDMFGHRIIELSPAGKVIRTLAREYNGVPFDGPNDIVTDSKGGIYITDPQFTPGYPKTQPGKSVFYRRPDGKVIRVVDPGEMGNPNGIRLSPDEKICYIANTRNMPFGNYVVACDVNEDGTLTNKRNFAKLFVPPDIRDKEDIATGADGMTVDVHGNIYVATYMGLQIFDKNGVYIGIVNIPLRSVNCVFGGDDMQTIFCTCASRIYKIRTNVKGLMYPLK